MFAEVDDGWFHFILNAGSEKIGEFDLGKAKKWMPAKLIEKALSAAK